ncbi:MAG: tetratricopeptide repeat protein [Ktedonobacteraceae bacterium]|nr:tetratricopeptide repeat protein [Ktedonobacteraceae bacterium]
MATQEQFCENCGAANLPTARFCQVCGIQLPFKHTTGDLPDNTMLKGRYQLEKRIGQGGMGAVYKAADTLFDNRPVAIKEMSRAGLSPALVTEAEEAFEREARLLAGLLHPNLPRIYDHFAEDERSYLIMDFIKGQTIEEYLEKSGTSPVALEQVLDWGEQLCDVLSYLHNHQPPIIFRDLKPSNVMIDESGHIFLIDFGIARIFKPGQLHDTVALGSPGYAAPEQYGKSQSTPRSDIYSLGALLHCLLTADDPSEQPFFFRPASQRNQAVPAELETLLQQTLEMDANKRPATAQDVAKVLRHVDQQRIRGILSTTVTSKPAARVASKSMLDAYTLYSQRRFKEASSAYERAVKTDGFNALAWQGLGLTQASRGLHREALASFERTLQLDPKLVTSWNGKGAALNMLQRNQEALAAFDQALLLESNNALAWNGKGAAQYALGYSTQALSSFDLALHFEPRLTQAWMNKGLVLRQLRRYDQALYAFDQALSQDRSCVECWNNKGTTLYEMGQLQGALQAHQQAIKLDQKYAPAWYGIGNALYAQHKLNSALDAYEQATRIDPRYVRAWDRRGTVLGDLGRLPEALNSYNKALDIDSHFALSWYGKGSILCQLRQYEEALDAYDRVTRLDPYSPLAWNGKGNVLSHLGYQAQALDAYQQALRIEPRMVSALHNKSLVLRNLNRNEEALAAADEAIRWAPNDPDNWQRKAEALRKLRRRKEAKEAEKEAQRLMRGGV